MTTTTTTTTDRKRPPTAWVERLLEHDASLSRVRLVWRTGRAKYRPIVSLDTDLDELEAGPEDEWATHELPSTHFQWLGDDDPDADPYPRVSEAARQLWRIAVRWAHILDRCCDFQLRGYDDGDELLFEAARRYSPHRDDGETRGAGGPEVPPRAVDDERASKYEANRDRLDERKDSLIEWLASQHGDAVEMAHQAASAAPEILGRTGDILGRAIDYQAANVQQLIDQRTGNTELRARAYAERQATSRRALTLEFGKYALDAVLGSVIPLGRTLFESWSNRSMGVFPTFEMAQQALAYLGLTLTQHQLDTIFKGNAKAASAFMAMLNDASSLQDEREALARLHGIDTVFKSSRFEGVATAEQQLAARYVIGRAAMYRMGDFDEDQTTT